MQGTTHKAVRRLAIATAVLITTSLGLGSIPLASAATPNNGVCETGEFCYYYAAGNTGSLVDFTGSSTDLTKSTFVGTGSGKGTAVRNNAHSVWNNSSRTVVVFYSPNYAGTSQIVPPGFKGNLISSLVNNEASHMMYASGSFAIKTTTSTYTSASSTATNGTVTAGNIYSFDCYSTGRSINGNSYWGRISSSSMWVNDTYINLNGNTINQMGLPACTATTVNIPVSTVVIGGGGSIMSGESLQLTVVVNPSNATNKSVTWTSSNTSVATVSSSGLITGKGTGLGKSAYVSVSVKSVDGLITSTTYFWVYTVQDVQARLNALNYRDGNNAVLVVDGIFGNNSANALKKFQAAVGRTQTGVPDTATVSLLFSTSAPASGTFQTTCPTGSICLYYSANQTGSYYAFTSSVPDLTNARFTSAGSGQGQAVRNNAHSVANNSPNTATVYYSPNYGGASQPFFSKTQGNLNSSLVNNEASVKVEPPATVSPTGVSLNKTSVITHIGEMMTLTATVSPSNATNKTVTWTSSNQTVVTVGTDGVLTGKGVGSATITVTTTNGMKSTATVNVLKLQMAYYALGDSYSAGEGVPAPKDPYFDDGTTNCHRSSSAYGKLLLKDTNLPVILETKSDYFQACTSAVMVNVTSQAQKEKNVTTPQMSAIPYSNVPTLVTMSIGGNDAKFADHVKSLFLLQEPPPYVPNGDANYQAILTQMRSDISGQSNKLKDTYASILKSHSNVKLMIVGYPSLTANKDSKIPGALYGNQKDLYQVAQLLDSTVASAVAETAKTYPGRIFYVSAMASGSPFSGHELGTADPFINGFSLFNIDYSYHPNKSGQAAYEQLVAKAIKENIVAIVK